MKPYVINAERKTYVKYKVLARNQKEALNKYYGGQKDCRELFLKAVVDEYDEPNSIEDIEEGTMDYIEGGKIIEYEFDADAHEELCKLMEMED